MAKAGTCRKKGKTKCKAGKKPGKFYGKKKATSMPKIAKKRNVKGKGKIRHAKGKRKSMQKPYKFLDHVADIIIEAKGSSFTSALQNIALGMFSVLGKSKPKESFIVSIHAGNLEELVVYTLSDILSECDAREFLPCKSEILLFDQKIPMIRMKVWGERKGRRDHIKAVTFHELMVHEDISNGEWTIRALFDV